MLENGKSCLEGFKMINISTHKYDTFTDDFDMFIENIQLLVKNIVIFVERKKIYTIY